MFFAIGKELDSITHTMDTSAFIEFTCRDGFRSVDSALIDPELQSVEIQGRKMLFVRVGESTLWNQACQWCLTAFEAGLWLAVSGAGLLTFVATGRGATAICATTTTQTLALLFRRRWRQVADPHSCGGICCR